MIIGIDFDGSVVTHEFPKVGKDIGAEPVLKKLIENGHKLILFTMRSNKEDVHADNHFIHKEAGQYLTDAVNWFKQRNIPLYGINTNPTQHTWTTSPKAYCELFIDDANICAPLTYKTFIHGQGFVHSERPFLDWKKIEEELIRTCVIKL